MQRCSRPRCPSFSLLFRTGKNIDNSSWSNSIAIAVVTPKCICTRSLPLFHAFACRFTYTVGLPLHPILYNFSPLPLSWNRSTKRACSFQAWLCACFPQQCLKRGSLWPGSWPCIFKVWASSPCGSVCYIVTWGNLYEQQKNLSDTKKDGVKWPFWIIFGLLVLWQLLQTVVILQIMAASSLCRLSSWSSSRPKPRYPLMVKDDICAAYFLSIFCLLSALFILCQKSPACKTTRRFLLCLGSQRKNSRRVWWFLIRELDWPFVPKARHTDGRPAAPWPSLWNTTTWTISGSMDLAFYGSQLWPLGWVRVDDLCASCPLGALKWLVARSYPAAVGWIVACGLCAQNQVVPAKGNYKATFNVSWWRNIKVPCNLSSHL